MLDKIFSDFDFKKNIIDDAVTSWEIQNASASDFEKICNILKSNGFSEIESGKDGERIYRAFCRCENGAFVNFIESSVILTVWLKTVCGKCEKNNC